MHYLLTGHTGFKGAWLTLFLASQGHTVSGISLDPCTGSIFSNKKAKQFIQNDIRADIRNRDKLIAVVKKLSPDVVIHLAAQSFVRESYIHPIQTFETNVMGTLNVLSAIQKTDSIQASLIITSDKVYKNNMQKKGFSENDQLGGVDPYSASKAMADILSNSFIRSFGLKKCAIARSGNVVGGGDNGKDRLLPDLIKSFSAGKLPQLRNPNAIRPWQHVLDCINGYYSLVNHILASEISETEAWNFGPNPSNVFSVMQVASEVAALYGQKPEWKISRDAHKPEADFLLLNSEKANLKLNWKNHLDFTETIKWTVDWHKSVLSNSNPIERTLSDIEKFYKIKNNA